MLGLDRGGMCRGIAFRVAAKAREKTITYLRAREQVTKVYVETMRRLELEEESRGGRCGRCVSSSTAVTCNMPDG